MTTTLRLLWPQWQGAEPGAVDALTPGLSQEEGRLAYGIGGGITAMLAPPAAGPTATVPVGDYDAALPKEDGIEAKAEVLRQNSDALALISASDPDRIVTIGGDCAVSLVPFSYLADKYGDDLAVVWLDSHADSNLPHGPNAGLNTMVVTHLLGKGDEAILADLPGTVSPNHVLLAGAHGWDDQDATNVKDWGLAVIEPAERSVFVSSVLEWLHASGCSRVAVHFDVDVIASIDVALGMAQEPNAVTAATALGTITAIAEQFELVGLTVAEFVPREAMKLRSILQSLPLLR